MSEMRDRSRRHIMNLKAVATHDAGGQSWASGGIDKAHHVPGLMWIDAIMGEFVDYLKKNRELDDSLLVFSADHGCVAKGHCFEPAMRVPMFAHCPKLIPKGTVVAKHVVANIDIAPTLLDFAGIDSQATTGSGSGSSSSSSSSSSFSKSGGGGGGLSGGDPKRVVDGRSLAPLVAPSHVRFDPAKAPHPEGIFCEIYSDRSVVGADYALVDLSRSHYTSPPYDRKPWGDRLQLYRLPSDAEMKVNLVKKAMDHTDPVAGHALAALKATLAEHMRDTAPACLRAFRADLFPTKFVSA